MFFEFLKKLAHFTFSPMNIFVAQLSYNTKEDTLKELFEGYGEVSSAKMFFGKFKNRSNCFGFVEMPDDTEAQSAINA